MGMTFLMIMLAGHRSLQGIANHKSIFAPINNNFVYESETTLNKSSEVKINGVSLCR
tara:strand:- start:734 stop:904 length:171 start_codon:yes stop_codon:yes gene_type:complete